MCLESAKRKIAEEYEAYKKEVLRCNNAEVIWDLCNRIAFFSCVAEYFEFSETIPEAFLSLVEKLVHPIYAMWMEYLKNESLEYARWEDIEMILSQMVEREQEMKP